MFMIPDAALDIPALGKKYRGREDIVSHFQRCFTSFSHVFCRDIQAIIPENRDGTEMTVLTAFSGIQVEPFFPALPLHQPFFLNMQMKLHFTLGCDNINHGLAFQRGSMSLRNVGDLATLAITNIQRMPPLKSAFFPNEPETIANTDEERCMSSTNAGEPDSSEDGRESDFDLSSIVDDPWKFATSISGCRAVQQAFDEADTSIRDVLARSLEGHVLEAAMSPNANHVLQKCIKVVEPAQLQFILEELQGQVCNVAKSKYGCRVLERILEHFPRSQLSSFVQEALTQTAELCRHSFGNFVLQQILRHGSADDRTNVIVALHEDAVKFAKHRIANHVLLRALAHGSEVDRHWLLDKLQPAYEELAHHNCGSFVAREIRRSLPKLQS
jgi:hypothetical protein